MVTVPVQNQGVLQKLQEVFRQVLKNPHSDFYRKHLQGILHGGAVQFHSPAEWARVPLLTRDDITSVSVHKRMFVPSDEVETIRVSGGTSGRHPLLVPRKMFGDYSALPHRAGVRRQATVLNGLSLTEESRRGDGSNYIMFSYPAKNEDLKNIARLIRLFRANSICAYPSILVSLAPHLEKEGIVREIEVLEMSGERCSPAQRTLLLKLYNNPVLFQNYGLIEAAGIFGESCSVCLEGRLTSFHLQDSYFFSEFIDPDTGESIDLSGREGELVITSLEGGQPFPLIRYRTGDLFRLEEESCACGMGPRFEMTGRAALDRVRAFDGGFHVVHLENAVHGCREYITEDFEAHCYERIEAGNQMRFSLELRVTPRKENIDLDMIAERLSSALELGSGRTYADAVRDALCLPMRVVVLKNPTRRGYGGKHRHLFRH